jgi:hypothetical protein
VESSKIPIVPFNIFTNVRYHHMKVVGNKTTLQTSTIGLDKSIKKSNILSVEEE